MSGTMNEGQGAPAPQQSTTWQAPGGDPKAAARAAKAYARASRSWYQKKRFIIPIVLVVIVVLVSALSGGDDEPAAKVIDGNTADAAAAGDEKKDDAGSGEPAGSKGKPAKVGDTVELEGTRYTVDSAETRPTVGGEFFEEKAKGVYVVVALTIENVKSESKLFSDSAAQFVAKDDTSYGTDTDATIAVSADGDDALMFEEMHPDLPTSGTLIFDVPPAKVAGGLLELSDLFGGGEAYIALKLK